MQILVEDFDEYAKLPCKKQQELSYMKYKLAPCQYFICLQKNIVTLEKFAELGIGEQTLQALAKKGFEEPSPIQVQTIPLLLEGNKNIIGQAQTGTGKTAAFGIPLVEKITTHQDYTQAIVLTPTRELTIQVAEEITSFLPPQSPINIATIYGGQSYNIQLRQLKKGADIIVSTPGRLIDMIGSGNISLDQISYFILDEADEMLNMGFIDDIKHILAQTPADKSMLLFSATMPKEIIKVAKAYMGKYEIVSVKKEQMTTTQVEQLYYEVNAHDKFEALCRIIDFEQNFFGIVFCKTKVDVDFVSSRLSRRGYAVEGIHGDVEQKQRERIIKRFKSGQIDILVATDVAARGIDINDITHVINYALPQDPESYVHRIGRTGRAGKTGTAITFVTPNEYKKILFYQRATKTTIKQGKIPEIAEVIASKKEQIKQEIIHKITKSNARDQWLDFSEALLADHDAKDVVGSLLALTYQDALVKHKYKDLSEVSIDKSGTTRLFIALGRSQGYTPRTLIEFLTDKTGVPASKINDLTLLSDFSFVNVSFAEAELMLHVLGKRRGSERPLISKAKERRSGGQRRTEHRTQDTRGGRRTQDERWGQNKQNRKWTRERDGGRNEKTKRYVRKRR